MFSHIFGGSSLNLLARKSTKHAGYMFEKEMGSEWSLALFCTCVGGVALRGSHSSLTF